jgi:hypothetical protein
MMNALCPKPGVYPDLSIDAYHNVEICPAPSIGGSGLVTLAPPEPVPLKFWWDSTLNPKREATDTTALRIGKAAHTLFLEGEAEATKHFAVMPAEMTLAQNAGKAFRAQAEGEGKMLIRHSEWAKAQAMAAMMAAIPRFRAAFSVGRPEVTLVWQDEETGVWCRCRPDFLVDDVTHLPELKTCRSAAQSAFERAIDEYGYHIKAAHIMEGCRVLGLGEPKTFTHYVVESEPPHCWAIHTLPRETIEFAEVQRRAALRTFARCLERNDWPGYPEHVQETGLPRYRLQRLQAADLSGTPTKENDNEPVDRSHYLVAG